MIKYLCAILVAVVLISCDSEDEVKTNNQVTIDSVRVFDSLRSVVLINYANLVEANYQDALTDAKSLREAVDDFTTAPSAGTQTAAKNAWLTSRESYGQTEAFRFYGGPIDDEDGPEGQLNAWPLDESYIDYVTGSTNGDDTNAGTNIINSVTEFPTITKESIAGYNEVGGEANVASGYHAVEFLLWGQDISAGAGGGERSFTDYLTGDQGTNGNQGRRATYLKEATALIVDDLQSLIDEWKTGGTYRATFLGDDKKSLENILSALGKLSKGELAGERMFVALDGQSKEDEHSCFSDNTHRDIVTNALGIQNVYLGKYKRTNSTVAGGIGIYDLLSYQNEDLAESIKSKIAESVANAEKIQAPFDQEIRNTDGQQRINATIQTLRSQGDLLAEAAQKFGFTFNPDDI